MKYIDAEKLKESVNVEFDKGVLSKCPQGMLSEFGRGYHVAMSWILNTINSLQQEQPEVELSEISEKYAEKLDISKGWFDGGEIDDLIKESFEAGAEWQYQKDREEFAKLKAKEWMSGYDDAVSRFVKIGSQAEMEISYAEQASMKQSRQR